MVVLHLPHRRNYTMAAVFIRHGFSSLSTAHDGVDVCQSGTSDVMMDAIICEKPLENMGDYQYLCKRTGTKLPISPS